MSDQPTRGPRMSGKTSIIKSQTRAYEQEAREKFVEIMQNQRISYNDCLEHIQNEIEQGKKMTKARYEMLCFRNDGIYQVGEAIKAVFGSVLSKEDNSPSGSSDVETVDIVLADGRRTKAP